MFDHVIVTPVRNEIELLPGLIDSIINQTEKPSQWVIVDDSSTDGSMELIESLMMENEWIKIVKMPEVSARRRGSKIAKMINMGLKEIDCEWTYFSKIDADIRLFDDYFSTIFCKFDDNKDLGIASGNCYVETDGKRKVESVENDHTRGALKTYRRQCFADIGGIKEINGWDGLDNLEAQFHGWETQNFPEIIVEHMRSTGASEGVLYRCFKMGEKSHILCYSWAYLIGKCLFEMSKSPYIFGGLCVFFGFISAKLRRLEKAGDSEFASHVKEIQRNKIKLRLLRKG
jgi:glycosyltransferase involved in cell wall biosynthesis